MAGGFLSLFKTEKVVPVFKEDPKKVYIYWIVSYYFRLY